MTSSQNLGAWCSQKSQKVVATTKALAKSAAARKRGAGIVVKPGLNDLELQVRTHLGKNAESIQAAVRRAWQPRCHTGRVGRI